MDAISQRSIFPSLDWARPSLGIMIERDFLDRLSEKTAGYVANLPAPDFLIRRSLKAADPTLAIGIGYAKEKRTTAQRPN